MKQAIRHLSVDTSGRGLFEMTSQLQSWVAEQRVATGVLTVFCQHTSASLLIQENADPSVQRDIGAYFERIAPEDPHRYEHATEGADDMPAHLRAALTQIHLAIPVERGQLTLGTWQGVYLFEHRLRPQRRNVVLHLLGE